MSRRVTRSATFASVQIAPPKRKRAISSSPAGGEMRSESSDILSPLAFTTDLGERRYLPRNTTNPGHRRADRGRPLVGSQTATPTDVADPSFPTGETVKETATTSLPPRTVKRKRIVSSSSRDPSPQPEPAPIPDVEPKETSFKGRLGYACVNTVLRNIKPRKDAVFCGRTCRISSIKTNGIEWLKELGKQNALDLVKVIQWNEENHIKFMRISSDLFPFASHAQFGYSVSYCADILGTAGDLAKRYNHRLTAHPGQFCQLGSPSLEVVASSVRELEYHAEMMDFMGLDQDGVMIVHGGGAYGDPSATLRRIKQTVTTLLKPNVRARLVLENDEMCYSAEDLLPLCEELDIPLVFDYHHDSLKPSSISRREIIQRANAIFSRRGIKPKQHLSEPRPGAVTLMERRAHADRCEALPHELPDDMDLMIEAKDKEQAVLHLYRIYGLQPVNRGESFVLLAETRKKGWRFSSARQSRFALPRSSKPKKPKVAKALARRVW